VFDRFYVCILQKINGKMLLKLYGLVSFEHWMHLRVYYGIHLSPLSPLLFLLSVMVSLLCRLYSLFMANYFRCLSATDVTYFKWFSARGNILLKNTQLALGFLSADSFSTQQSAYFRYKSDKGAYYFVLHHYTVNGMIIINLWKFLLSRNGL